MTVRNFYFFRFASFLSRGDHITTERETSINEGHQSTIFNRLVGRTSALKSDLDLELNRSDIDELDFEIWDPTDDSPYFMITFSSRSRREKDLDPIKHLIPKTIR